MRVNSQTLPTTVYQSPNIPAELRSEEENLGKKAIAVRQIGRKA